jgi:pyruvate formate lyase activating enzyme
LRENCAVCGACAENCPTAALAVSGREMTVSEMIAEVARDSAFYGEDGGVTLSGGELFVQHREAIELLKLCKSQGINTAVETCGYFNADILDKAIPYTDLFLWDIKDTNSERHKRFTGVSNETVLKNLREINETGARIRLRCILVNGVNTDKAHYEKIGDIAKSIRNFDGVEFIPYHAYGGTKATFIGKEDNGNTDWIPDELQTKEAKSFLRCRNITVK